MKTGFIKPKEGVIILNKHLIAIGKRWIENHLYSMELFHHGIKGQKWGVRNGPPYPLEKSSKSSIIEEAIRSGRVKKTINREKQLRHTKSHHTEGRSYLDGDLEYAQRLVDELSGTGEALLYRNGEWKHKERVTANHYIGVHVDEKSGKVTRTKHAMIVYSKTGSHIYPRKENENG